MKCSQCRAVFSWEHGFIVHVEDCPIDAEVFGVGVAYIEGEFGDDA